MVGMGFLDFLIGGNTLYYEGCLTRAVSKKTGENYEKIIKLAGIDCINLRDAEICCGSPVVNAGYFQDFADLQKKNERMFREHAVKKILLSCPGCYHTFADKYDMKGIECKHMTVAILEWLKDGKLKIKRKAGEKIAYHDPCHLGRCAGIYREPRDVLKVLGYEVVEMDRNRREALCCGGGGSFRANFPQMSSKIAQLRTKEAEKTGSRILVTPCPLCYEHMKENNGNVEVWEFSEAVLRCIE
jgi:Fe-S oxidoreductase